MELDIFARLNKRIPGHTKICFATGLLVGWLTHFYMLTHKLVNWDDINNLEAWGSGDYLGRWFLKYIHKLGSSYSIPAVRGFIFILCLTLSACVILEIVQIKSALGAVLVPAVLLTFPSAVSTMTFMFMAHTSGIAILMTCTAVYLLRRYRFGWLACMPLLICALGTYQSYVSFAITLMLMGMLSDIFHGKKFGGVLRQGILYAVVLGASVWIYMQLSHIIWPNIDNETYGGVGSMGEIALGEMPRLIARCYKRFLEYFLWKPFAFVSRTARRANTLTCALAFALFGALAIQRRLYREILTFLMAVLVCFLMPLAAAFIYFMAPEAEYSMLMLYPYALVYVEVLALLEYCMQDWNKIKTPQKWRQWAAQGMVLVTAATIFVSCYTDYLLANRAYLRTDMATERVKAYFNRVIAMAESSPGFQAQDRIALLGEFHYRENPSSVELDLFDSEDLRELSGVALENGLITSGARENFIRTFIGYETAPLEREQKEALMNTEAYRDMPVYPQDGCVKQIDGIWVVKMCE